MPTFADHFDAQSQWRRAVCDRVGEFMRFLQAHRLADEGAGELLAALTERLASDRLIVAFVAEFSRGKSELINAIFFGDTGRRVLPATPGRTTMCPVELAFDAAEPPSLSLLPIATRLDCVSLSELRQQPARWSRLVIDLTDPDALPQALQEVTRTLSVSLADARQLGFWDDQRPDDNPPLEAFERVLVPAWRHALINYPHPLLRQGLVVVDTPGLNAIGAEPELTLGLLPSAHAIVFVLGADTGVTKSDKAIWCDHLDARGLSRFVVLNKIDALADPLLPVAGITAQVESQRRATAASLGLPLAQVFALSARQALAARVTADDEGLAASGIEALEQALAAELLPLRRNALREQVVTTALRLESDAARQLGGERREVAEQLIELAALRGKSGGRLALLLKRVDADAAEFEQCTSRLQALRSVHARMLKEALAELSSDQLRSEVEHLQAEMAASLLHLGARRAFAGLCQRLRALLSQAGRRDQELREMLAAQFERLNTDFGFVLAVAPAVDLDRFTVELDVIERSYLQFLGLGHVVRLANLKFREQFRRMLVARLRVVFETASAELERWSKTTSALVDTQLRDRRRGFRKRREALQRVQAAAGELESRLAELTQDTERLSGLARRVAELGQAVRDEAANVDSRLPTAARAA